jgi:hypothetical protein
VARVLIGDAWYDGVSSHTWNERHFEDLVVHRAPSLFAGWECVPFSEKIYDASEVAKQPDLALIDPQYRAWWVIEVELAHHSLNSHVLPQVQVFRQGKYDVGHAEALYRKAPHLDAAKLAALMIGDPPGVLVIVDSLTTGWREPLRDIGVRLAIAEPFRDLHGTVVLRLNGDQPDMPAETLTRISRMPYLRRMWKVHAPAALPPSPLSVEWEGVVAEWTHVAIKDGVAIQAERGDVLSDYAAVDLVRREDGRLAFVPVQKIRRSS